MNIFYIITNPGGYIGFGISQNIKSRIQKYTSHTGTICSFHLYKGNWNHIKALESYIKTQLKDKLWKVETMQKEMEWLDRDLNISLDEFTETVEDIVNRFHYDVKLFENNITILTENDF
jgi:phosphatidate phosphatase PAH1|tara:strand:- start:3760 stop:4116 length:357 start_codon:yes stop_codon:yes gene_type:complete